MVCQRNVGWFTSVVKTNIYTVLILREGLQPIPTTQERHTRTPLTIRSYNEYDTAFRHSTDGSFVVHPDHEIYQIHSHSHTNGGVDDGTYHAIPSVTFQGSTYDYNNHNDIRRYHNHQQLGLQSQQYKSNEPPSE